MYSKSEYEKGTNHRTNRDILFFYSINSLRQVGLQLITIQSDLKLGFFVNDPIGILNKAFYNGVSCYQHIFNNSHTQPNSKHNYFPLNNINHFE